MAARGGNRQALLDAAIRCIEQTGYARTTARALVTASGTNLGAIGYHFGSKEALLNEALAECCRRWMRRLTEDATGTSTPDGVRDAIEVACRAVADNRALAAAYVDAWAQAQHSDALRNQLAGHYAEFREMTATLVRTLLRPDIPPTGTDADLEALSAVIVALTDGLMVQWLLDPSAPPDSSRLADAVRALALTR